MANQKIKPFQFGTQTGDSSPRDVNKPVSALDGASPFAQQQAKQPKTAADVFGNALWGGLQKMLAEHQRKIEAERARVRNLKTHLTGTDYSGSAVRARQRSNNPGMMY